LELIPRIVFGLGWLWHGAVPTIPITFSERLSPTLEFSNPPETRVERLAIDIDAHFAQIMRRTEAKRGSLVSIPGMQCAFQKNHNSFSRNTA